MSQNLLPGIREVEKRTWIFLILSGAATGLSWLFYFKALQLGDVSRVAPIDKMSVIITILLAFLFLKEPVNLKVILGALFITTGSIILLFNKSCGFSGNTGTEYNRLHIKLMEKVAIC